MKAVKSAAETMRPNPKLKLEKAITELEVGEALISFLDEKGSPTVTERLFVVPPGCRLGPLTREERAQLIAASPIAGHYEKAVDRESAFEILKSRTEAAAQPTSRPAQSPATPGPAAGSSNDSALRDLIFGKTGPRGGQHDGLAQTLAKSAVRTIGSSVGREIMRGVLGSIFGKTRR